ncbi:Pentatricopeptide repeat (PPR) superfamily protein [Rhynchospora pubera]|uniref:Pentatricopeptide repeat (PPR) superfamily protein n=1 Tax=Rhynchospora pubera TaxID=906938 RepID=A0AAV8ECN3_9POAL|nr:Pentatricopeptide repeat (PPR) superfamily protein [Rhynchospora pubera]KAJ4784968.1 Pentatricopeptide repeat (PPR) superfamily protein [Rhynchospora pubera]
MSIAADKEHCSPSNPSSSVIAPRDPRVVSLHQILANMPSNLEEVLSSCGIDLVPELVEAVLRLSYSSPSAALRFFRWAGLSVKHTLSCWNLIIDILGKNSFFEVMWDIIGSMKRECGDLSLATFASVFSSYCSCGQFKQAVMSFQLLDRFGITRDVVALNTLIKSFCHQDGHTADAVEFLEKNKGTTSPNGETFTILLEGWQKEGNAACAKKTFGEMLFCVGWSTEYVAAYNAFLLTLIHADEAKEVIPVLKIMKSRNCAPGMDFFTVALEVLVQKRDFANASVLWDIMAMDLGILPDLQMYHCMVVLSCENNNIDFACKLLDQMPFNGVFPNSAIYGAIFDCLVRMKNAREAEKFFAEMRKNEQVPSASSCASAIRMFFKGFNPMAAREVWRCVVEEKVSPADDCAQEVIRGFSDLYRLSDVECYIEEMLSMGIEPPSNIIEKLKAVYLKKTGQIGKTDCYERIAKKLKPLH